jgi:hypothetical protein
VGDEGGAAHLIEHLLVPENLGNRDEVHGLVGGPHRLQRFKQDAVGWDMKVRARDALFCADSSDLPWREQVTGKHAQLRLR